MSEEQSTDRPFKHW